MSKGIITIDDIDYEYFVEGEGNIPLICVHGWAASYLNYFQNIAFLSNHFKLYLFNFPGNFSSPTWNRDYYLDDYVYFLKAFVNKLDIQNYYILGESFGSIVAVKYLLENKSEAKGVYLISFVINSPNPFKIFMGKILERYSTSRILNWVAFKLTGSKAFQEFWVKIISNTKSSKYDAIKKLTMDELDKVNSKTYIQGYISMLTTDTLKLLKKFISESNINKVFFYGRHDPFSHFDKLKKSIPNLDLMIIDHCKHSPHLEEPDVFQNTMNKYIL